MSGELLTGDGRLLGPKAGEASWAVPLALFLLAAPAAVEAQQARKTWRVGFLVLTRNPGIEEAFPRRLGELGYVEGRDTVIEWRSGDGRSDLLPTLAADLVQLGADIIVTAGPEARIAAMKATSTIPIVTVGGFDPVAEGWAASLARPGGNVTGLTVAYTELTGKRLELLKQMIPRLSRVAAIWDPTAIPPSAWGQVKAALRDPARALGIDHEFIEVRGPADFPGAFRRAVQNRRQALILIETGMIFAYRADLAERARQSRLPTIGAARPSASAGYLATYGADVSDLVGRAAGYVDRIIMGAKPGDLPIERPGKFEVIFNLKTAKALGLTIPHSLLLRADAVIQ